MLPVSQKCIMKCLFLIYVVRMLRGALNSREMFCERALTVSKNCRLSISVPCVSPTLTHNCDVVHCFTLLVEQVACVIFRCHTQIFCR